MVRCSRMIEEAEGIGEFFQELKQETFAKHDAFTVAEVFNMKEGELDKFVGEEGYFSTMFDFAPLCTTLGENGWYDAPGYEFFRWRKALLESQKESQKTGFLRILLKTMMNRGEQARICLIMHRTMTAQRCWRPRVSCCEAFPFIPGAGDRDEELQNGKYGRI